MRRQVFSRHFDSLFIPARRPSAPGREKLMIVLHGQGDSYESFREIDCELDIPWMNFLIINAPDAYDSGFSWYKLEPKHAPGIRRSRALLKKLLAQLQLEGWRTEDIFLLGHSQGALMACDILLNSETPFAGVIGVSGYVWFFRGWKRKTQMAAQNTPWLMTYGLRDSIIPPEEIQEDLEILWDAGLPVTARAFNKGHDFNFAREVPYIRNWLEFLDGRETKDRAKQTSTWTPKEKIPFFSAPRRLSRSRLGL